MKVLYKDLLMVFIVAGVIFIVGYLSEIYMNNVVRTAMEASDAFHD